MNTPPQVRQELTADETAWLLMDRVNYLLAATFGPDFELGHAYVLGLRSIPDEKGKYRFLAETWDQRIYPLLQERFAGRPNELEVIISRDAPATTLIRARRPPNNLEISSEPVPTVPSLSDALDDLYEQVRATLWYLARG